MRRIHVQLNELTAERLDAAVSAQFHIGPSSFRQLTAGGL